MKSAPSSFGVVSGRGRRQMMMTECLRRGRSDDLESSSVVNHLIRPDSQDLGKS